MPERPADPSGTRLTASSAPSTSGGPDSPGTAAGGTPQQPRPASGTGAPTARPALKNRIRSAVGGGDGRASAAAGSSTSTSAASSGGPSSGGPSGAASAAAGGPPAGSPPSSTTPSGVTPSGVASRSGSGPPPSARPGSAQTAAAARPGPAQSGSAQSGSARPGSAQPGSSKPAPSKPAPSKPRPPRRARLRLTRVDPWSVMKTAFLLSIALGIVTVVAVLVVWSVLGAAGVWDSVNATVEGLVGEESANFDVENYVGMTRVIGFTMLVAVIDVILLTALATLGAFLYNMSAALLGGIEVTLVEDS